MNFGVCEKLGVKLKPSRLADAFRNLFIVKKVLFGNDLDVGFFGARQIGRRPLDILGDEKPDNLLFEV